MDVPFLLDIEDIPDPILLEQGWTTINHELEKLTKIIEESPQPKYEPIDFLKAYQMIYTMCTEFPPHDYSEQLYDKYKQTLKEHINTIVLSSLTDKYGEVLLEELIVRWEKYEVLVRWFSHIFSHLERVFIDDMPLNEVGIKCFHDMVVPKLSSKVIDAEILLINQEREGEQVNTSLLRRVLHLFLTGKEGRAFADAFGKSLVKASGDYYSHNAKTWFMDSSCTIAYLKKASECLKKESERAAHFFDENDGLFEESTKQKLHSYICDLTETANANLLEAYASTLINDENFGFYALLKDQREEDMSRMYSLLLPFSKTELIAKFTEYITDEATTLVQRANEAASNQARQLTDGKKRRLIRGLIDLNYKALAYLKRYFGSSYLEFHKALKGTFEEVWRLSVAGSPILELLATSCDNILKNDEISQDDLNEDSDFIKVVQLVEYVRDKEMFAERYRIMLAHRLFSKRDTYDYRHELENEALKILNQHCGEDISKMFAMVEDMRLTKGRDECFKNYLLENPDACPDIDLRVTVITNGLWPFPPSFNICLPAEMVKCLEAVKPYFKREWFRKVKHRWAHSLGSCHINVTFDQKIIELVASVDQAAALMLFNSSERLSFSEIMTQLNLEEKHTVKLLHSLACAKFKILTKEPKNMIVSPTDYFEFNSMFTDHEKKIRIIDCLQDPLQQEEEDRELAVGNVDLEKRFAIQVVVMRIMKREKSLDHGQLVSLSLECLTRYELEGKAIKAEIEYLIGMDYLRRNEDNPSMYEYLPES